MYAIIEDSGSQIKVSEGDVIKVDVRDLADDQKTLAFDRVLMVGGNDDTKIGAPYLKGARVEADIITAQREKKISVIKFKRRKGYRRKIGHRQNVLCVKVTSITQ